MRYYHSHNTQDNNLHQHIIMKRLFTLMACILTLALTSCEPTLDATTMDTMSASLSELTKNLNEEEKEDVAKNMIVIAVYHNGNEKEFLKAIDGKSLSDI